MLMSISILYEVQKSKLFYKTKNLFKNALYISLDQKTEDNWDLNQ